MYQLMQKFDKIKGNDKAINNVLNEFTGSEGFISMLQLTAKNAGETTKAFQLYNDTQLDMIRATQNANENVKVVTDSIKNKFNTALSDLGTNILPAAVWGLQKFEYAMDKIHWGNFADATRYLGSSNAVDHMSVKKDWNEVVAMTFGKNFKLQESVPSKEYFDTFGGNGVGGGQWKKQEFLDLMKVSGKTLDYMGQSYQYYEQAKTTIDKKNVVDGMLKVLQHDDYKSLNGTDFYVAELQKTKLQLLAQEGLQFNLSKTIPTHDKKKLPSSLGTPKEKIHGAGTGSSVRNVTVHIHKIVGIDKNINERGKQGAEDIGRVVSRVVNQEIIKAVRDSEIALAH
jgi:hypothetical protein